MGGRRGQDCGVDCDSDGIARWCRCPPREGRAYRAWSAALFRWIEGDAPGASGGGARLMPPRELCPTPQSRSENFSDHIERANDLRQGGVNGAGHGPDGSCAGRTTWRVLVEPTRKTYQDVPECTRSIVPAMCYAISLDRPRSLANTIFTNRIFGKALRGSWQVVSPRMVVWPRHGNRDWRSVIAIDGPSERMPCRWR